MTAARKKLLTLQQAVELINSQYKVDGFEAIKLKTLYNKIWEKKLINYGTRRKALVSSDEILSLYGSKLSA
jgi:hypothetical protein